MKKSKIFIWTAPGTVNNLILDQSGPGLKVSWEHPTGAELCELTYTVHLESNASVNPEQQVTTTDLYYVFDIQLIPCSKIRVVVSIGDPGIFPAVVELDVTKRGTSMNNYCFIKGF